MNPLPSSLSRPMPRFLPRHPPTDPARRGPGNRVAVDAIPPPPWSRTTPICSSGTRSACWGACRTPRTSSRTSSSGCSVDRREEVASVGAYLYRAVANACTDFLAADVPARLSSWFTSIGSRRSLTGRPRPRRPSRNPAGSRPCSAAAARAGRSDPALRLRRAAAGRDRRGPRLPDQHRQLPPARRLPEAVRSGRTERSRPMNCHDAATGSMNRRCATRMIPRRRISHCTWMNAPTARGCACAGEPRGHHAAGRRRRLAATQGTHHGRDPDTPDSRWAPATMTNVPLRATSSWRRREVRVRLAIAVAAAAVLAMILLPIAGGPSLNLRGGGRVQPAGSSRGRRGAAFRRRRRCRPPARSWSSRSRMPP